MLLLQSLKQRPVVIIVVLILFVFLYISLEGGVNYILSLLKLNIFKTGLPSFLEVLSTNICTSKEFDKQFLDEIIFFSTIFVLFFVYLFSRQQDFCFKDSDLMWYPLFFSLAIILFLELYPNWVFYYKFIDQHIIFKALYYFSFILFILYLISTVLLIKDVKYLLFNKILILLFLFLFYIFIFSHINLWFFYVWDPTKDVNYFLTIEELRSHFDSVLSLYVNISDCSGGKNEEYCKNFKETKEFWCQLYRQMGHIPSVKGGEPGPRIFINGFTTLTKMGASQKCNKATADLINCIRELSEIIK